MSETGGSSSEALDQQSLNPTPDLASTQVPAQVPIAPTESKADVASVADKPVDTSKAHATVRPPTASERAGAVVLNAYTPALSEAAIKAAEALKQQDGIGDDARRTEARLPDRPQQAGANNAAAVKPYEQKPMGDLKPSDAAATANASKEAVRPEPRAQDTADASSAKPRPAELWPQPEAAFKTPREKPNNIVYVIVGDPHGMDKVIPSPHESAARWRPGAAADAANRANDSDAATDGKEAKDAAAAAAETAQPKAEVKSESTTAAAAAAADAQAHEAMRPPVETPAPAESAAPNDEHKPADASQQSEAVQPPHSDAVEGELLTQQADGTWVDEHGRAVNNGAHRTQWDRPPRDFAREARENARRAYDTHAAAGESPGADRDAGDRREYVPPQGPNAHGFEPNGPPRYEYTSPGPGFGSGPVGDFIRAAAAYGAAYGATRAADEAAYNERLNAPQPPQPAAAAKYPVTPGPAEYLASVAARSAVTPKMAFLGNVLGLFVSAIFKVTGTEQQTDATEIADGSYRVTVTNRITGRQHTFTVSAPSREAAEQQAKKLQKAT